jgi:hypothetical protein
MHADFKARVLESGEESVDSIGVPLTDMGVEEACVDEVFADAFFAGEELLALEAPKVSDPFLVGVVACHVCPRGRVEYT